MKAGSSVQAILTFSISNMKDCNVGITDKRNLLSAALKWGQVE
jgi:hypothetical protein